MKNTFGNNVTFTIFGESHGEEIGAVIDGMTPGVTVDEEYIASRLALRRPSGRISTARVEEDKFRIVSGVFNGRATGTPITILIPNTNTKSGDYARSRALARPGHADYTAHLKYNGFEDYRGGGHFSGRITAGIVAAGAIAEAALAKKGIKIGTHIKRCAGIDDAQFTDIEKGIDNLHDKMFPVLDDAMGEKRQEAILAAATDGDSVGGILETYVAGFPAGVGEPMFDSIESELSHILFSVPAVKGVEFGAGFGFADLRGSQANDPMRYEGDKVVTLTNNNGGINGGISNGMPIHFKCVIKPTPSIFKKQETVDFINKENGELELQGRHDPAIIHRARIVIDSVTAMVLMDMLAGRYGADYFAED